MLKRQDGEKWARRKEEGRRATGRSPHCHLSNAKWNNSLSLRCARVIRQSPEESAARCAARSVSLGDHRKMQPRLLHFLSSRIKTHLGVTGHRGYPSVSLSSMQFNLTSGLVYITFMPQHHQRWRKLFLPKKKENKAFHPNTIVLKVGETQNPCYPAV